MHWAEVGVKGATEHRGTHTGHFELAPVHKMFMHRLSSPGLGTPDAGGSPATSLKRRSSELSAGAPAAAVASRPAHTFSVEQGSAPPAEGDGDAKSGAALRWKGVASAFQAASTAVQTCLSVVQDLAILCTSQLILVSVASLWAG